MENISAVEWLLKQYIKNKGKITSSDVAKAKEMEKQQIKDAWDNGIQWEWNSSIRNAEQYYNKTLK